MRDGEIVVGDHIAEDSTGRLRNISKPYPTSMRATWPGTDVIIELKQDEDGDVCVSWPQSGYPVEYLSGSHDADIIRRLGFYVPDLSVPAKECGEMGRVE